MRKVWAIIRREVVERVRTRAFMISTLLFPILMGALIILPGYLMTRSTGTKRIALVDATGDSLGPQIDRALTAARIGKGDNAPPRYRVTRIVAVARHGPDQTT